METDHDRPMLWIRPQVRRSVLVEHLRHVAGSFEAAGWRVTHDEPSNPPRVAPLAVIDDPWVEPLPKLASALASPTAAAPAWRVPLVWGLAGPQGWRPRRPPATLLEYERRTVRSVRRRFVPLTGDLWYGFAVAAASEAGTLLGRGWPPREGALVTGAFLYRYTDPSGHERRELIPYIPADARTVVDVGCGGGLLGGLLRRPGRRVIGIEPDWELAAAARARLDAVLPVNGEEGLRALRAPIDCVVLADVLEHTVAPQHLLRLSAGLLGPGGRVVVSFPNAAWAPVLRALTAGRWDVALAGVQARDHLFFTTPRSFVRLAEECGLVAETLVPLGVAASRETRLWARLAALSVGGDSRDLAAPQWVAVLKAR